MSIPGRDELKTLTGVQADQAVSIYLPTHRAMPETQQDPVRFRNLLAEAENRLLTAGSGKSAARALLAPARKLLEDSEFWRQQSDGLAVFVAPDCLRFYRVPLSFSELVVVAGRFHLKPLLRLYANDGRFYLLALSQNEVRLFLGTQHSINELFLSDVPRNLAAALASDDPQRQLQFHTGAPHGSGRRAAVFHGHGVGIDDDRDRLLRYCREIDAGLRPLLREEAVPLLLAGVEHLFPIYAEVDTSRNLLREGIAGNPELLSASELHQRAWQIVAPYFQKIQDEAKAGYQQLAGTGRTSSDLREIIPAAVGGRVAVLFVASDVQRWGCVDDDHNIVELHDEALPGDEDLLDLAAVQTLINGGDVFVVTPRTVPGKALLAAVYRY